MRFAEKYFRSLSIFFLLISNIPATHAFTNVSGGIFANTTWTLAGSPYIVIDTVVVFQGVTLTIEPGVVVKFDNDMAIEVRDGNLFAVGTSTDSITFTSNSTAPYPLIYFGIFFNYAKAAAFEYCNFSYGEKGIYGLFKDSIRIEHCYFKRCYYGINFQCALTATLGKIRNCLFRQNTSGMISTNGATVDSCIFSSNQIGIEDCGYIIIENCTLDSNTVCGIKVYHGETIRYNQIRHNNNGIMLAANSSGYLSVIHHNIIEDNIIGIDFTEQWGSYSVYCNFICNNVSYDFQNSTPINSNCIENNYWCLSDSAQIEARIYDAHDNATSGIMDFIPFDTVGCYLINPLGMEPLMPHLTATLYPNPAKNYFSITGIANLHYPTVQIFDQLGQLIFEKLEYNNEVIDCPHYSGIFIVRISDAKTSILKRLIVE